MADKGKQPDTLVDEKQALGIYLESLLRDVPEADEELVPVETPVEPPAAPAIDEPVVEVETPAPARVPEPEPQVAPAAVEPAPAPVVEPEPAPPIAEPVSQSQEPSPWEGIPEWGEEPFQALLFKLSGLTMAIPLIELDGILEWPDSLTPLPNRSAWYLGLLDNRGKTLPVIELAQLVIPPKIRNKHANEGGASLSRIILIGDGRWGVACDSVSEVITLNPDEVRWRSSRSRRQWLAGTVVDHMCALLDAQGLVHLLSTGQEVEAQ
ncbi:MAG: chemotaxis protein CheW [Gammaproteobacteria bacterium]|nr:chemotaxis protein CheW [Gammaproteobacteria bacterium]